MFTKKLKLLLIILALNINTLLSDEFSEGPYGINYFDIAESFSVPDLNISLQGDVNLDETINIQDVILLIGQVLGNTNLNEEQLDQADLNNDNVIDVLDIVNVVSKILYPQNPEWNLEQNWTGNDSYIFIHFDANVSTSSALWGSSTREQLLTTSPNNIHYFFISNRTQYESDMLQMKEIYDEILEEFSLEDQNHWNNHLHFINEKTSNLNNWLSTALTGKFALAIDSFQQLREIGYLGNPATFSGTYIHYLAHEALYFDYENNTFSETNNNYNEITIFDREHYTGGWAASISQVFDVPNQQELSQYNKMEVELLRGCPDENMNYSDAGCDDYDRIARLYFCDLDGSNCYEIAKWITPFDRQPHSLTDISPFLSILRSNENEQKTLKFQESGWPNSLLTIKLRLYNGVNEHGYAQAIYPLWNNTVQFNPDYEENRPAQVFSVPSNATKVEFVSYISGHGWGSAGCFNCCEFCNSRHVFSINGGVYEFNQSFPNASSNTHCMDPETIQTTGVIPNQYGTWGYGRAGWCPGRDVKPYIMDITEYIIAGDDNVIDYNACRVSGNSCVSPPTCAGDGYCPEIAMSSYIIIYY
ncbi:peptide-N-glycosidase F-related protein [Candidatus Marinimicrobia bacterium]|nr:peptide-N-glycosidase F-related protein [Candidatus Neomarinimicrobiota bacterium]